MPLDPTPDVELLVEVARMEMLFERYAGMRLIGRTPMGLAAGRPTRSDAPTC